MSKKIMQLNYKHSLQLQFQYCGYIVVRAGLSDCLGWIIFVVIAEELPDEHNEFQFRIVEEFEALLQPFSENNSSEEVLQKLPLPLSQSNSSHGKSVNVL